MHFFKQRIVHRLLKLELRFRHLRARRRGDPWNFTAPHEQFRFQETNRVITQQFGRVGSLLELGCGEGHQSEHLVQTCDQLTGIDFSPLSVERARERVPQAEFEVGNLEALDLTAGTKQYDLVVACECLYYLRDMEAALRQIDAIGRQCLVSSVQLRMLSLDAILTAHPGVQHETIEASGARWRFYWWTGGTLFPQHS